MDEFKPVIDEWLLADWDAHAFARLGGVPSGTVRYDNLNAAVARVIGLSRLRVETDRWTAFRSHWDLDVSTASQDKPGLTKRVAWKAISGGSAATTLCRCLA